MEPINVRRIGRGPTVVLVHGTLTTAAQTWARQEELAERWTLVIPDRRGYPPNPMVDRSDFEVDAADLVPLLGDGAHLVGHSYGAMGALFAAAGHPDLVRSITVIEPPTLALIRGRRRTERRIEAQAEIRAKAGDDPAAFMRGFLGLMGAPVDRVPSPLPEAMDRQVRLLMVERLPWDLPVPVDELRAAAIPTLVVSGNHDPLYEDMCDALVEALGPVAERRVIEGRGHVVQRLGPPFNDVLEAFLRRA